MPDWRAEISCRPGDCPIHRDPVLFERLVSDVRRLDAAGASDDEVAARLKPRTICCGEGGAVIEEARGIEWDPWETAIWRENTTRWELTTSGKTSGSLVCPGGDVYEIGDVLGLPDEHTRPHARSAARRDWPWQVIEVVDADPACNGRLLLEPFNDPDG